MGGVIIMFNWLFVMSEGTSSWERGEDNSKERGRERERKKERGSVREKEEILELKIIKIVIIIIQR